MNIDIPITEASPCETTYLQEGAQIYVKLEKANFENILSERRTAIVLLRIWMILAVIGAVGVLVLAAGNYWVAQQIQTAKVVAAATTGSI